ncbi:MULTISPECIES: hypothetical protein [unclassified Variovorax]|uniref:hypothetical protein n=1 Tax=unclassified Variovorax TaxID=663243 RepID=UPI003F4684B7
MTTANPPASAPAPALFFSRLQQLQTRSRTGRLSTWPFKVAREPGPGDLHETDDVRVQAARVIRTTAESWWPPGF